MQDQSDFLDDKFAFSFDALPVMFPPVFDVDTIMALIKSFVDIIRKLGAYRFVLRRTSGLDSKAPVAYFFFQCAQSDSLNKAEIPQEERKRDVKKMERFHCSGTLRLDLFYAQIILAVHITYHYHSPYVEKDITPEAYTFINENRHWTPGKLNLELRLSNLPGCETTTSHQVYYRWKKANQALWRFDVDQAISA